uniref:RNA polymerase II-associated factor 1 homolog n=1 Tax=Strongyloides venezuelensis TaxID=75913 RepID=A0A0K0FLP8_STRVS
MTVQNDANKSAIPAKGPRDDLIQKVELSKTLPETPNDPKLLEVSCVGLDALSEVTFNKLIYINKQELFLETHLGIFVDLVDTSVFEKSKSDEDINQIDAYLLEDEVDESKQNQNRSGHNISVPWMRKAEYIASDYNRHGASLKHKAHRLVEKNLGDGDQYLNIENRIEGIERTFEDITISIDKHPTNKDVYVEEELDIYPDFENWKIPFVHVTFDRNPFNDDEKESYEELTNCSMLRGNTDEEGIQYCEFLVPKESDLQKVRYDIESGRKNTPFDATPFDCIKEYNWNIKSKVNDDCGDQKEFFLSERNGKIYFNEMDTSVSLKYKVSKTKDGKDIKRRKKEYKLMLIEPTNDEQEMMYIRDNELLNPYSREDQEGNDEESN